MNKFWEWMTARTGFNDFHWINHNRENWKSNLIGHMLEYLFQKHSEDLHNLVEWSVIESVDKLYSDLEYVMEENK